ncbi:alpha/beta fold hydrolase [Sphingomonas immobilis]|uniref:Alpha/beta hydrolase n=1 Tax=Sphingomonas immobilis TaxID=3063997 RepID=A0ABT8ZTW6_9SPHN|nr:alpha/beta hydrolase [Sphingomonas sp. CA1-15]MDO7841013.1 alpha/beta hydrolase [Sphingomonas sp. CA1-15]
MASPPLYRREIPSAARITQWRAPDGWMHRRFDWPAEGHARGSLLFQTGRGDIFEKYLEAFSHWQARGWSITAFDWRGQGGSGRLGDDTHVGHVENFAHYIADFRAFWAEWSAESPGTRVAVGHSMGGHLVLRAVVEGGAEPDALVLVAPMLGLRSPVGEALGERVARLSARIGNPRRPAWRANVIPATTETRQALLTHDVDRYQDEIFWQTAHPDLAIGPPSWRWLAEAFASTRALQRDSRLAEVRTPVLMLVAEEDRLVSTRASLRVAARLPDAKVVRFGREAAHELLREADGVRDVAIGEIDAFFDVHTGARA